MSIDAHFSRAAFIEEKKRDPGSGALASDLEREVQEELHGVIIAKVREIVDRLNAMGHMLKEYTPPIPGDIAYRDDQGEGEAYECFLRLGVDTVVSTGFQDTKPYVEEDEEGDPSS
jgi:hypothetical protein